MHLSPESSCLGWRPISEDGSAGQYKFLTYRWDTGPDQDDNEICANSALQQPPWASLMVCWRQRLHQNGSPDYTNFIIHKPEVDKMTAWRQPQCAGCTVMTIHDAVLYLMETAVHTPTQSVACGVHQPAACNSALYSRKLECPRACLLAGSWAVPACMVFCVKGIHNISMRYQNACLCLCVPHLRREVSHLVTCLAHSLTDRGFGKGDSIGVYGINSPEWVISMIVSAEARKWDNRAD